MALTRRDFLNRVGQAGGYSAAFLSMQALGLMPGREALAQPMAEGLKVAPGTGKGVKVAILGGGIAGLVAAYEMRDLGYEVTVLEARNRPGGRNWTVRGGDKIKFLDGTEQTCRFDEGNYQNVGPARLPSIHRNMLGYCKKLGVQLEVEINTTRSAYLQNDNAYGGKPIAMRRAQNDTRGHVSELLMKCVNGGALDADLSKEDRDRMLTFLRTYGSLDNAGKYMGSDRAGYSIEPGAGDQAGTLLKPIDMHTLLDENFWQGILFEEGFDQQATMFQPVGGIDRIPYAFAKALGEIVHYNAPVTEIRKTAKGVRIGYTEGGKAKSMEADYCICALPLTILKKIPNDFDAPHKKMIADCTYASAYKIAWESRRFWEQDYNVYGGLQYVMQGPSPVWMPSAKLFAERGVLVSGYTPEDGTPFQKLSVAEKLVASRGSVEKLHPGHGKELEKPIYVTWGQIQWNEGSWIKTYDLEAPSPVPGSAFDAPRRGINSPNYETLIQPDGPIYFCGCHASHIVAWQEGAALSSHRAIQMISDKVKMAKLASTAANVFAV